MQELQPKLQQMQEFLGYGSGSCLQLTVGAVSRSRSACRLRMVNRFMTAAYMVRSFKIPGSEASS